jgi:hypothetical protein
MNFWKLFEVPDIMAALAEGFLSIIPKKDAAVGWLRGRYCRLLMARVGH